MYSYFDYEEEKGRFRSWNRHLATNENAFIINSVEYRVVRGGAAVAQYIGFSYTSSPASGCNCRKQYVQAKK